MDSQFLYSERLVLKLESTEDVLARIAAMPADYQSEVSPEWLSRLRAAPTPSPWTHGFVIALQESGTVVGSVGFKGSPDADGMVEIAYGIIPEHQRQGYAREAARALSAFALGQESVRGVRAHTLLENKASARVLTACGFTCLGEVFEPEDGLVQRWELRA